MEPHLANRTPRRQAGALALVIATITLLASCALEPPPALRPKVESTPEQRYQPIDVEVCDRAKLYELASEVGLAREREYFRTVPTIAPEPWELAVRETIAVCQFLPDGYRPDTRDPWFAVSVTLELRSFPGVAGAHEWYDAVVLDHPPDPGLSSTLEEIDGWWDEGVSIEYDDFGESSGPRDTGLGIHIYLRHANLYLYLRITGKAPEADAPEGREIVRELAWLVVDETMRHVSEIEPD